ncbi:hypothetical protein MD484_g5042, partial [Candolleomyces efflorescens]
MSSTLTDTAISTTVASASTNPPVDQATALHADEPNVYLTGLSHRGLASELLTRRPYQDGLEVNEIPATTLHADEPNIYLTGLSHRDLAPELLTRRPYQDGLQVNEGMSVEYPAFQDLQTQSMDDAVYLGSMMPLEQIAFAEARDEANERMAMVLDIFPGSVDWHHYPMIELSVNEQQWDMREWDAEELAEELEHFAGVNARDLADEVLEDVVE